MSVELRVHESRRNECREVVEDDGYLEGGDVLNEGIEMAVLILANIALRRENVNMDAVNEEEKVGNKMNTILFRLKSISRFSPI